MQFLKMVLPVLPIGLTLIAVKFLRRGERSRLTFWLQTTAGVWLLIATANRFMLTWSMGVFSPGDQEGGIPRILFFERISVFTWTIESVTFIGFAILLLIYFHRRLDASGQR